MRAASVERICGCKTHSAESYAGMVRHGAVTVSHSLRENSSAAAPTAAPKRTAGSIVQKLSFLSGKAVKALNSFVFRKSVRGNRS